MEIYSEKSTDKNLSKSENYLKQIIHFWKRVNNIFSNNIEKSKENQLDINSFINKKNIEFIINWDFWSEQLIKNTIGTNGKCFIENEH